MRRNAKGLSKVGVKAVSVFAACALTCAMVGCSPSTNEEEVAPAPDVDRITTQEIAAQDIEITQSGYSIGDDGTLNFALVAHNPNTNWVAQNVNFSVTAYDDAGKMLIGTGESAGLVYPGIDVAIAGSATIPPNKGALTEFNIDVDMDMVTWEWTDINAEQTSEMFKATDVSIGEGTTTEGASSLVATGMLSANKELVEAAKASADKAAEDERSANPGIDDVYLTAPSTPSASVVVVLLDEDGNVVGGAETTGLMSMPFEDEQTSPEATPTEGTEGGEEGAAEPTREERLTREGISEKDGTYTGPFTIDMSGTPSYASYVVYAFPSSM